MNPEEDDLIEVLQRHNLKPRWFGLGFIQVKVDEKLRYHFWHPELVATVPPEEIHDHRYAYHSRIIRGKMDQRFYGYEFDEGEDAIYELVSVSCDSEKPGPIGFPRSVIVYDRASVSLVEGSDYYLPCGVFHTISAELCVTAMVRSPVQKRLARVIRPFGTPHVCPFAEEMPEDKMWKLMDECMRFSLT